MSIRSSLNIVSFMLFLFLVIAWAEGIVHAQDTDSRAVFEKRCSRCHSLDKTNRTDSEEGWKDIVNKMKKKFFSGISDEDAAVITAYLVKTKGPNAPAGDPESDKTPDK